jgi:MFS family permease
MSLSLDQPSLTHRSAVRRIAIARAISIAGAEAAYVAIVATMLDRTGSAAWVSAALLAWIGVGGLVSPIAGSLGDRYDRRRVMIVSDLAGAATFAAIAFVHDPRALLALTVVAAIAEAPFNPAASAAIPNLTPQEDLSWANGLVGAGRTFGGLAGPVMGGLLYGTVGAGAAFAVNAASFLLSALLIATVRGRFSERRDDTDRDVLAGFRFVGSSPFLRSLACGWSLFLLGIGLMLVAELPMARLLGAGSLGYGLMVSGWAAGALAGSLVAKRVVARHGELRSLVWGAGCAAVALGAIGVAPWLASAAALLAAAGFLNAISAVAEETMVQRSTPDAVRSRVMAAQEAIWIAALGIGLGAGGGVIALVGVRATYLLAGVLGLAGTLLLAWLLIRSRGRVTAQ